ncbi:MAG: S24/S26 family peptidase [Abditibacteriota bacterium]|nr:S24/S26 family peptidase [Abditibacteriota bacterium]
MLAGLDDLFPVMEQYLNEGKEVTFTITGKSMAPTLRHGKDQVTLARKAPPYKRGDLLFYRRDSGAFVLHRVLRAKDGAYVMCGDGQISPEEGVEDRHVLAVSTAIIRDGRRLSAKAFSQRVWVGAWLALFPLRRYLLAALRRMRPEYFVLPDRENK